MVVLLIYFFFFESTNFEILYKNFYTIFKQSRTLPINTIIRQNVTFIKNYILYYNKIKIQLERNNKRKWLSVFNTAILQKIKIQIILSGLITLCSTNQHYRRHKNLNYKMRLYISNHFKKILIYSYVYKFIRFFFTIYIVYPFS